MDAQSAAAQEPIPGQLPEGVTAYRDLAYVVNGHLRQKLDLYLPNEGENRPLIIWIHGGAFHMGSKERNEHDRVPVEYVTQGYALASINHRLSQHATFPAQIEDCKAAVRWPRGHASEYGLDGSRFVAWGPSAGGHLASMLGTSWHYTQFDTGAYGDVYSGVQCVVDWFGPTDFLQMDAQRLPHGMVHDAADSPESELVGGPIQENPEKVAAANPITYVTNEAPPFLIVHGDQDPLVPYGQSMLVAEALKKAGASTKFYTVSGGGHGQFTDPQVLALTAAFLAEHLGMNRVATAEVTTPKAERYLKALCNHFDRRSTASYEAGEDGTVTGRIAFSFGTCDLSAKGHRLDITASAVGDEQMGRLKNVIASHLIRFAGDEELRVSWANESLKTP